MQNMHNTAHDRQLTGVHWPIHRDRCMGSGDRRGESMGTSGAHRGTGWETEAIIHVTTRGLDRFIDRTISTSSICYNHR